MLKAVILVGGDRKGEIWVKNEGFLKKDDLAKKKN
jgi:hypothetical protein